MIRTLISIFFLSATAGAQEMGESFSLRDFPARVDEMNTACDADPNGPECRVQIKSVLPSAIEALSFIGYQGSYDAHAALLRDYTSFPVPEIQAAALYALARLGPREGDLPLLREALTSASPGVRRAALGALKALPDERAQELVTRGRPFPSGSYFTPDLIPFDPQAIGVGKWPEGPRFLFFHKAARGTYAFTSEASRSDVISAFEESAGVKATGMGDVEARFGAVYADILKPWIERNATKGAVEVVLMHDEPQPSEDKPALLALVYDDYAMGATGFALVRLPGTSFSTPPRPREEVTAFTPPTGDAARWFDGGAFIPKDGAGEDDVSAWRDVRAAAYDATYAQAYLDQFPSGAYRTEAEGILAAPAIDTDLDVYSEQDPIHLNWRNLPEGIDAEIFLSPARDTTYRAAQADNQQLVNTAAGEAVIKTPPYIKPGVYDVQIIDNQGSVLAAKEIRIALAEASLSLDRNSVKPGETITVSFADMPGEREDAISIAAKGAEDYTKGSIVQKTGGAPSGSVQLSAPSEPGAYEVRAWFGGDSRVRGKAALTVRGPDLPLDFTTPPTAPALSLLSDRFTANEKIMVRYGGFAGNGSDYVSIAPAGADDSTYYTYAYAKEKTGVIELTLPPEPGAYEVRGVIANKVEARTTITITEPEGAAKAKLTLEKATFAPGEVIMVTFDGMSGSKNDYVTVTATGARYSAYESYVYTKGEVAGTVELKAPSKAGSYEIRAFFNEKEDIVRGVVPITVTAPP